MITFIIVFSIGHWRAFAVAIYASAKSTTRKHVQKRQGSHEYIVFLFHTRLF